MNFTEFEKKNLVKEKGFSWEVEKDTMEREHDAAGIESLQEKINRNMNWFDAAAAERYDYLYTPEELRSFLPGIKHISGITSKTIVMFNNCHAGKSVKNAIEMLNLSKNILAFL